VADKTTKERRLAAFRVAEAYQRERLAAPYRRAVDARDATNVQAGATPQERRVAHFGAPPFAHPSFVASRPATPSTRLTEPPTHRRTEDDNAYLQYFRSPLNDDATARKLVQEGAVTREKLAAAAASGASPESVLPPPRWRKNFEITALKPECARVIVKLEKVLDVMADEDKEFARFRKRFVGK
jgi:hypothetical protein